MRARNLLSLYPRTWRARYGEELLSILGDRVRPRDAVDVVRAAANEWVSMMTGTNRWNNQAQRTAIALAQAAGLVIAFRTLVPPILGVLFEQRVFGSSNLGLNFLYGFVSSLLQSAVTLGPVALVAAVIPWHSAPFPRVVAGALGTLLAARIASHVAWGEPFGMLLVAAFWVGYRSVGVEQPSMTLQGDAN